MRLPCDAECARANHCGGFPEIECSRCGATVLKCEVDEKAAAKAKGGNA